MELRHLRYFVVAAEEQNFRRAAERLFVAQTAISRRIQDLESELGVQLFYRHQKRVTLSEVGQVYLQEISRALKAIDEAGEKSRLLARGDMGILSLGFHDTAIRCRVAESVIQEFRLGYPGIELKLDPLLPAALLDAVQHGTVDAALLFDDCFSTDMPGLEAVEIAQMDYVLAIPASHPLAASESLQLSDLKDVVFIWSRRDIAPTTHDRMIAASQAGGLTPRIVQSAPNESTRLQLVSMGMGVAFALSSNQNYPSGQVVFRRVSDFSVPMRLYVVWRRENNSPTLKRFISAVEASRDLPQTA